MTAYSAYLAFISGIVQQAIFTFLLIGAAAALLVGLLLVFKSEKALRVSDYMNRWVSSRAALRPMEAYHDLRRPLYRWHRFVGVLICAGALYSLVVLGSMDVERAIVNWLSGLGPAGFRFWIAESLKIMLLAGNFVVLVFGVIFIFRPSALKGLEGWADRRFSGRAATKPLEQMHVSADEFVRKHPRLTGALAILGSLYVLVNFGYLLLR